MPISLNHLKNDKRTITADYFGDPVNLVYKPSELTPTVEAEIRDNDQSVVKVFCKLIVNWDVVDEKGEELPITEEVVGEMPSAFLNALIYACRDDMIPKVKSGRR